MPSPRTITWLGKDLRKWSYKGDISVCYTPETDGGGIVQSDLFIKFFEKFFPGRIFENTFEWCSGPGFIGFSLFEVGITKHLTLSDLNPVAVDQAVQTIKLNNLNDKVRCFVSDNFKNVPTDRMYDLIVGNPPHYVKYNSKYVLDSSQLLRGSDPEWKLHRDFFKNVKNFLAPDGIICISCYKPFDGPLQPEADRQPIDIRNHPPILDFKKMITENGLELIGAVLAEPLEFKEQLIEKFPSKVVSDHGCWFLVIRNNNKFG